MKTPSVQEESKTHPEDSSQWIARGCDLPEPSSYCSRFDWLGPAMSFFMMIVALPFIVGLVVLTKLTSRGPGIYRQTRVGLGGNVFTVYKIRTMSNDAESASGPVWTSGVSDPRVTALGKFMRASHLDELPQLFNVLKGEMSLIGPRPERPEFTQFLAREIPGYVARLSVKPGITGLAQVLLPADSDLESVRKKLGLDLKYVDNSGLVLDLKIAFCTATKMFGFRSTNVANWVGLARSLDVLPNETPLHPRKGKGLFGGRQKGSAETGTGQSMVDQSVSLSELVEKSNSTAAGVELNVSEPHDKIEDVDALATEETVGRSSHIAGTEDPSSDSVDRLPTT
jgi:lipopolysaccharide/colanic/teichoic acid biosynthesis glycosyltransferase